MNKEDKAQELADCIIKIYDFCKDNPKNYIEIGGIVVMANDIRKAIDEVRIKAFLGNRPSIVDDMFIHMLASGQNKAQWR